MEETECSLLEANDEFDRALKRPGAVVDTNAGGEQRLAIETESYIDLKRRTEAGEQCESWDKPKKLTAESWHDMEQEILGNLGAKFGWDDPILQSILPKSKGFDRLAAMSGNSPASAISISSASTGGGGGGGSGSSGVNDGGNESANDGFQSSEPGKAGSGASKAGQAAKAFDLSSQRAAAQANAMKLIESSLLILRAIFRISDCLTADSGRPVLASSGPGSHYSGGGSDCRSLQLQWQLQPHRSVSNSGSRCGCS